jgi:hypothetical protein
VDVLNRAPSQHHELLLQQRGHGRSHQWMDLLCTGLWGPTQLLKTPAFRLGCWALERACSCRCAADVPADESWRQCF